MNAMFVLVFVGCVYGLTITGCLGESCTTNSDCTTTTCSSGNVICQHPDGAGITTNGGLCTCTSGGCSAKEDCYGTSIALNCPDSMRHCYDQTCICNRFPTGRK